MRNDEESAWLFCRFNFLDPLASNVFARFSSRSGPVAMLLEENLLFWEGFAAGFLRAGMVAAREAL